jgi:hypothetical protein
LSRRTISLIGLAAAFGLVMVSIRCDYSSSSPPSADENESLPTVSSLPGPARTPTGKSELASIGQRRDDETRKALLDSAMTLIQRAALQPGGDNFKLAVQKLNQYFEGTPRSEYELDSLSREYLRTQFPPRDFESLSDRNWTDHDTRHIEDCMMYYPIATRIAGTGENLARVRRVFEWAVLQTQLVPPGRLALGANSRSTRASSPTAGAGRSSREFPDMDFNSSSTRRSVAFASGRSHRLFGSARRSSMIRRISSTRGLDWKFPGLTEPGWPRSKTP